jgi:hypothetical protein
MSLDLLVSSDFLANLRNLKKILLRDWGGGLMKRGGTHK